MHDRFTRSAITLTLALLLAAAPAAPAAAQDADDGTRVGVGVSISGSNSLASLLTEGGGLIPVPSILVPIDVNEAFRIEPVVGYTRISSETSFGDEKETSTATILRLGAGFFAKSLRGDDTNLYYGARVGYNRLSQSFDTGDETVEEDPLTGFFVGPTVGGSYFFSDFFSIGGEVEARYTTFHEEEEDTEVTNSTITLRPSLVVRFYF